MHLCQEAEDADTTIMHQELNVFTAIDSGTKKLNVLQNTNLENVNIATNTTTTEGKRINKIIDTITMATTIIEGNNKIITREIEADQIKGLEVDIETMERHKDLCSGRTVWTSSMKKRRLTRKSNNSTQKEIKAFEFQKCFVWKILIILLILKSGHCASEQPTTFGTNSSTRITERKSPTLLQLINQSPMLKIQSGILLNKWKNIFWARNKDNMKNSQQDAQFVSIKLLTDKALIRKMDHTKRFQVSTKVKLNFNCTIERKWHLVTDLKFIMIFRRQGVPNLAISGMDVTENRIKLWKKYDDDYCLCDGCEVEEFPKKITIRIDTSNFKIDGFESKNNAIIIRKYIGRFRRSTDQMKNYVYWKRQESEVIEKVFTIPDRIINVTITKPNIKTNNITSNSSKIISRKKRWSENLINTTSGQWYINDWNKGPFLDSVKPFHTVLKLGITYAIGQLGKVPYFEILWYPSVLDPTLSYGPYTEVAGYVGLPPQVVVINATETRLQVELTNCSVDVYHQQQSNALSNTSTVYSAYARTTGSSSSSGFLVLERKSDCVDNCIFYGAGYQCLKPDLTSWHRCEIPVQNDLCINSVPSTTLLTIIDEYQSYRVVSTNASLSKIESRKLAAIVPFYYRNKTFSLTEMNNYIGYPSISVILHSIEELHMLRLPASTVSYYLITAPSGCTVKVNDVPTIIPRTAQTLTASLRFLFVYNSTEQFKVNFVCIGKIYTMIPSPTTARIFNWNNITDALINKNYVYCFHNHTATYRQVQLHIVPTFDPLACLTILNMTEDRVIFNTAGKVVQEIIHNLLNFTVKEEVILSVDDFGHSFYRRDFVGISRICTLGICTQWFSKSTSECVSLMSFYRCPSAGMIARHYYNSMSPMAFYSVGTATTAMSMSMVVAFILLAIVSYKIIRVILRITKTNVVCAGKRGCSCIYDVLHGIFCCSFAAVKTVVKNPVKATVTGVISGGRRRVAAATITEKVIPDITKFEQNLYIILMVSLIIIASLLLLKMIYKYQINRSKRNRKRRMSQTLDDKPTMCNKSITVMYETDRRNMGRNQQNQPSVIHKSPFERVFENFGRIENDQIVFDLETVKSCKYCKVNGVIKEMEIRKEKLDTYFRRKQLQKQIEEDYYYNNCEVNDETHASLINAMNRRQNEEKQSKAETSSSSSSESDIDERNTRISRALAVAAITSKLPIVNAQTSETAINSGYGFLVVVIISVICFAVWKYKSYRRDSSSERTPKTSKRKERVEKKNDVDAESGTNYIGSLASGISTLTNFFKTGSDQASTTGGTGGSSGKGLMMMTLISVMICMANGHCDHIELPKDRKMFEMCKYKITDNKTVEYIKFSGIENFFKGQNATITIDAGRYVVATTTFATVIFDVRKSRIVSMPISLHLVNKLTTTDYEKLFMIYYISTLAMIFYIGYNYGLIIVVLMLSASTCFSQQSYTFTLPIYSGSVANYYLDSGNFSVMVKEREDIYTMGYVSHHVECSLSGATTVSCSWASAPACSEGDKLCRLWCGAACSICNRDLLHNGGSCWSALPYNCRRLQLSVQRNAGYVTAYKIVYHSTKFKLLVNGVTHDFVEGLTLSIPGGVTLTAKAYVAPTPTSITTIYYRASMLYVKLTETGIGKNSPFFCTATGISSVEDTFTDYMSTGLVTSPSSFNTFFEPGSPYFSPLSGSLTQGCTVLSHENMRLVLSGCTSGMVSFELTTTKNIISKVIKATVTAVTEISATCLQSDGIARMKFDVTASFGLINILSSAECSPKAISLQTNPTEQFEIACATDISQIYDFRFNDHKHSSKVKCISTKPLSEVTTTETTSSQVKNVFDRVAEASNTIMIIIIVVVSITILLIIAIIVMKIVMKML